MEKLKGWNRRSHLFQDFNNIKGLDIAMDSKISLARIKQIKPGDLIFLHCEGGRYILEQDICFRVQSVSYKPSRANPDTVTIFPDQPFVISTGNNLSVGYVDISIKLNVISSCAIPTDPTECEIKHHGVAYTSIDIEPQ